MLSKLPHGQSKRISDISDIAFIFMSICLRIISQFNIVYQYFCSFVHLFSLDLAVPQRARFRRAVDHVHSIFYSIAHMYFVRSASPSVPSTGRSWRDATFPFGLLVRRERHVCACIA